MTHQFALILNTSQVSDAQVNALFEAGLDDGTVSTSEGVTRIDIARGADTLESAIRSATGQVNAACHSVATVEIEAERIIHQPAT